MARWPGWTIAVPAALALVLAGVVATRSDAPPLDIDASATGVEQTRLPSGLEWTIDDGIKLQARATFSLTARVLSAKRYRSDGIQSVISPLDLALGWGLMSDPALVDRLEIRQSGRWYHYRWEDDPPADPGAMATHSSNMHIIPATPLVRKVLLSLDKGDVVSLSGHLVDARAPDGWRWITSMSRTDTGNGACELFRVEHVLVHE